MLYIILKGKNPFAANCFSNETLQWSNWAEALIVAEITEYLPHFADEILPKIVSLWQDLHSLHYNLSQALQSGVKPFSPPQLMSMCFTASLLSDEEPGKEMESTGPLLETHHPLCWWWSWREEWSNSWVNWFTTAWWELQNSLAWDVCHYNFSFLWEESSQHLVKIFSMAKPYSEELAYLDDWLMDWIYFLLQH